MKRKRKWGPKVMSTDEPYVSITQYEQGKSQFTCRCSAYSFPHRMGGGDCYFAVEKDDCPSCDDGACEFHGTKDSSNYDPRSEALTAAQRNPDLTRRNSLRGGW